VIDPQDMTFGQRIALTFVIVLIILFALAFAGWMTGGWDESPAASPKLASSEGLYDGISLDAELLLIDREALDQAYHNHLIKLWTVWLTDGAKDPTHFRRGLMISRDAYKKAHEAIAKREEILKEKAK
jgi:hypothetical protein